MINRDNMLYFTAIKSLWQAFKTRLRLINLFTDGSVILLFLTTLVPLVIFPALLTPYTGTKTIVFQLVVALAAFIYFVGGRAARTLNRGGNKFLVAYGFYLLLMLVASLMARWPLFGFLGTVDRYDGLLTHLHYFLFIYLLLSLFSRRLLEILFDVSIVISLMVATVTVFQATPVSIFWGGLQEAYPVATIGNGNALAGYLLFSSFFLWFRWQQILSRFLTWLPLFGQLLLGGAIYFTQARLALILFILVSALFIARRIYRRYKQFIVSRTGILIISAIILSGLTVWVTSGQYSLWSERLFNLHSDPSLQARSLIWQISLSISADHPLTGVGPVNFRQAFDYHLDPLLYEGRFGGETIMDKAHNIVLDVLTQSGWFGLVAWFIVWIVIGARLFLLHRRKELPGEQLFILSIFFLIYAAYMQLNFETIVHVPIFLLFVAYLFVRDGSSAPASSSPKALNKRAAHTAAVTGIVIFFLISWAVNLYTLYTLRLALVAQRTASLDKSVELYERSLRYPGPAHYEIARSFQTSVNDRVIRGSTAPQTASDIHVALAQWYSFDYSVQTNTAIFISVTAGDQKTALDVADKYWSRSAALSPRRPDTYLHWADVKRRQNQPREAVEYIRHALALGPRLYSTHWNLGIGFYNLRDPLYFEDAAEHIRLALELGFPYYDQPHALLAIEILTVGGQRERAITFAQEVVRRYPQDSLTWANLAQLLYSQRQWDAALDAMSHAAELDDLFVAEYNSMRKKIPSEIR